MGEYEKCSVCGKFGFVGSHRCPPAWEVNIPEYHGDEWVRIYGFDSETAAEEMADIYDSDDYGLLSGGSVEILVRKPDETETTKYRCTGESVAQYHATKIPKASAAIEREKR